MAQDVAMASALVSVAGAIVAIALGVWTARQARAAQQVAAYRAVHDLYDKMVQLKFNNPDFLIQARDWDEGKMRCVYDAADPRHADWSRYYTFVELCIGFANAVLQARERHLMGDREYTKQWQPLVRLVVAEHYPIILGFVGEGPYLSQYLRDYIVEIAAEPGWDWAARHRALTW